MPYNTKDSQSGWEVLYIDNNNAYIITKGRLENTDLSSHITNSYGGSSDFTNPAKITNYPAVQAGWLSKVYDNGNLICNSSKNNIKATEWLLDSKNVWNSQYTNIYSQWAIGTPTLEMIVAAFNSFYDQNDSIDALVNDGYQDEMWNFRYPCLSSETVFNKGYGKNYWVAAPSKRGAEKNIFVDTEADMPIMGPGGIVGYEEGNTTESKDITSKTRIKTCCLFKIKC